MASTYTASTFKNNMPKANPTSGVMSVEGSVMWGATSVTNDVAFLCKIPHGAEIVDFWEYHTTGASTQVLSFGLSKGVVAGGAGNNSCLVASGAQAAMNRFSFANWKAATPGNLAPLLTSMSDLDTVKYATLTAILNSGTTTTSLKVYFSVQYRMDGPAPNPPGALEVV